VPDAKEFATGVRPDAVCSIQLPLKLIIQLQNVRTYFKYHADFIARKYKNTP